MKKYILIITAIATTSAVFGQKSKVIAAYSYEKAFLKYGKCSDLKAGLDAINVASENEQTKDDAKTWYYRGNLYYNIISTKDEACKVLADDALGSCTDSYLKALVLNFVDPELKKIDLLKEDGSGFIKFNQALESNPKLDDNEYLEVILSKIPGLSGEFANQGIVRFTAKDYKGAQESFGKSMLLGQFTGKMDTMILYNTALASEYAEDNETAKQLYDALIMLKYNVDGNGADLYRSMSRLYKKEGNNEKAMEYIKKGRVAYPENNNLIVEELEDYLQSGNSEKALENLNVAITNDPKNAVLYFARGTVNENLKKTDNAVADYKKALEVNPDYYDAAFNLGAFYFNAGADKINEANKLPLSESKKYEAYKAEAKVEFEKAVPFIEKAHALNEADTDTGNMLIKLYTHTGQYDKVKIIKAKYQ